MSAISGIPFSSRTNDVVDTRKPWMRQPMGPGLGEAELQALVLERFPMLERDKAARWNLVLKLPAQERPRLRELMQWLRDDERLRFACLLDLAGIDYLSYPNARGPRFAVVYQLKSLVHRHRLAIKAEVEEDSCELPSLSHLWRIADWQEREVYDQFGVIFAGHPDLRRLLNHHEFVGHPLRKDYPVQKRQKLSINDPMVDQLEHRLRTQGFTILDPGQIHLGSPIARQALQAAPAAAAKADAATAQAGGPGGATP
jgi:NADH-quinone oxidoreductase subunit C